MNRTISQYPASATSTSFVSLPPHSKILDIVNQPGYGLQAVVEEDMPTAPGYETHVIYPLRGHDTVPDHATFLKTLLTEMGTTVYFYVGKQ